MGADSTESSGKPLKKSGFSHHNLMIDCAGELSAARIVPLILPMRDDSLLVDCDLQGALSIQRTQGRENLTAGRPVIQVNSRDLALSIGIPEFREHPIDRPSDIALEAVPHSGSHTSREHDCQHENCSFHCFAPSLVIQPRDQSMTVWRDANLSENKQEGCR